MFGTFGTIFLIITILFGGGGVTVAAAQDSMPDQALYPVKTWSESVRAQMTTGEMNQLRLALELAERRAEEMQMMFRAGQTPPQAVQNQWEGQLDEALRLAAGLTHDPQFQAHLEKVQSMAQVQQQTFKQVGPQKDPAGEALLTRTQAKLGEILMMCKQGQQDPNAFQHMVQNMQQKQARDGEPASEQNQEQNQEQNGEPAGSQNQEQNQEQNGEHAGDQNQEQNQEQHQYQECTSENGCKGPYGPGEGAGPGPGDGAGDGSGTGVGSGGSGSDDSGSDNTGGSNAGSGSTGSDDTGGDASGSESNGSGETGGSGGGNGGGK